MAGLIPETIPVSSLVSWIEKINPENPIIFQGIRTKKDKTKIGDAKIHRNGIELPLHREIQGASHTFEWGYGGGGPIQSSVAILHSLYGMSEMQMIGEDGPLPTMISKVVKKIRVDKWYLTDLQITLILSGKATFEQLCPQYVDWNWSKKEKHQLRLVPFFILYQLDLFYTPIFSHSFFGYCWNICVPLFPIFPLGNKKIYIPSPIFISSKKLYILQYLFQIYLHNP